MSELIAGPLTVRHVEKNGHESITQALTVTVKPRSRAMTELPRDNAKEVVARGVPQPTNDGCNVYANGRVYVMNEAGATVAVYNLD